MKGLLLLFVTFCVVPLALSSRLLTASSSDVVVDLQGKELKLGEPYYAISKGTFHVEGLCLHDLKNETSAGSGCPHDVIQCTILDQPLVGLPIIFSNSSSSAANLTADSGGNSTTDAFVMDDNSYTIKFAVKDNSSSCAAGDTTWGLAKGSDTNSEIVTTDPAANAVEFQLSREGLGYKISYCITIPLPHVPICYAIGFIQDGLYSRLGVGLGIEPVQFVFVTNPSRVKKHATS